MQNNNDNTYIIDECGNKIYIDALDEHIRKKKEKKNERRDDELDKDAVRELGRRTDEPRGPDKVV